MEKMEPWSNTTFVIHSLMTSLSSMTAASNLFETTAATAVANLTGSSPMPHRQTPIIVPMSTTSRPVELSGNRLQPISSEESRELFQGVHTLLTIVALACNCISLFVTYGVVSRLTAPLQLLTSLAFGEMLVPWAVVTIYFARSSCQDEIHTSVLLTGHNAIALTLIGLAATHHVATFRPLHYERLASRRRVWATVAAVWIISLVLAHIQFLVSLHSGGRRYCEQVARSTFVAVLLSNVLCYVACLVSGVIYFRIMRHLRPVEAFLNPSGGETGPISPRSTRGVITGISLIVTYGVVWMPYFAIWMSPRPEWMTPRMSDIAVGVCQTLIVVNCAINPVVYGWRMTCMRLGYSKLFQRCRSGLVIVCSNCRRRLRGSDHGDPMPTTPLNHIDSVCY